MKIKFNSDGKLPPNKTIVVRTAFYKKKLSASILMQMPV